MAEAIENNPYSNTMALFEVPITQVDLLPDIQELLTQLGEQGLWDAQDREAKLGAYTASDLSFVERDIPENPFELLQLLWSEYVSANPNLPDGKVIITGRTARAHNLLPSQATSQIGSGREIQQNSHLPKGELIFKETTTTPVT